MRLGVDLGRVDLGLPLCSAVKMRIGCLSWRGAVRGCQALPDGLLLGDWVQMLWLISIGVCVGGLRCDLTVFDVDLPPCLIRVMQASRRALLLGMMVYGYESLRWILVVR